MNKRNLTTLGLFTVFSIAACKKDEGAKDSASGAKSLNSNHYRELIPSDVANFNWITESDKIQTDVLAHVYENLLDVDPETYEPIPRLAKSWSVSKDFKSFTFELDPQAKWFDGQPVTSEDVAFTFEVIFDPKTNAGPMQAYYGSLDPKVQVIDSHKLIIKAKNVHFNNLLLAGGIGIIPKHLLKGTDINKGPLLTQTMGSGPYMLESWDKGDRITLKKNPNYWGMHLSQNKGAYNFEKLVFKVVREPKVGVEMLKEGFFSSFEYTSEQWEKDSKHEKIAANYDNYNFINKAPKGYSYVAWNNRIEPFNDAKVRTALSHLMNRKFMIEKFTYGYSKMAAGPVATTSMYFPSDVQPIEFSPEKAAELFKKAGWADSNNDGILDKKGKKMEFTLMFSNPDTEKYLTVYKEDLRKAGVNCELKRVDWTTFTKLLDDRKFEAVTLAWTASVHPDLEQIWHSDSSKGNGSNFIGYSNKQVDKLIKDAQKEFDVQKRIKIVQDYVRLIANDQPYSFFLERPTNFVAARKGIKRPKDYYNYTWGTYYWTPSN